MYNSNDFPQIKFLKKNKKKNSSNFKKPIYLLAPIFLSGLIFSNYDSKPVEVKEKKPNIEIVKNNTTPVELVVKRIVKKDENLSKLLNQNKILEAKITNYENRFSSLEKRLENAEGIIGKPMLNATTLMDINFDGYLDEVVPYSGGSVRVDFKDNLGKKILSSALSPDAFSKVFLSYMFTQEELDKMGYSDIKDRILNKNVRKIIRKNPALACEWIKIGYATGNLTMEKKYLKRPIQRLKNYHRKAGKGC